MLGVVQDEQREDDYVTEISGISVYVENALLERYGGFEIDYASFLLMRGYFVTTKNYSRTC